MGAAGSVGGRAEAALRGGQKEGKVKGQTDGQKDEEEEKRSEASESTSTPERRTGARFHPSHSIYKPYASVGRKSTARDRVNGTVGRSSEDKSASHDKHTHTSAHNKILPERVLEQVVEAARGAVPAATIEAKSQAEGEQHAGLWNLGEWVRSLQPPFDPTEEDGVEGASNNLFDLIGAALTYPLNKVLPKNNKSAQSQLQLAYVRALGHVEEEKGVAAIVHALTQDASALRNIARALWTGAHTLAIQKAESGTALQSKFISQLGGDKELKYGKLNHFFAGLEGLIGAPSPNLREAMESEHCTASDAMDKFVTPNYSVTTTSQMEWWFVVDHEQGLRECGISAYPSETIKDERMRSRIARKKVLPSFFEGKMMDINESLEQSGVSPVLFEELIAARLYTGPLFTKYNLCLRAEGARRVGQDAGVSADKLKEDYFIRSLEELCKDNRYVTTLHVLNSAIVKLGKIVKAQKVYRGVGGRVLPKEFWEPNELNVKGGIEFGFMSTTQSKEVAMTYAMTGECGTVLEIQMGMIDRGADLTWLSQYPHECEILFSPLTGLEMLASRVEGQVLIVEVRLSVNLTMPTIEQVVAKMRRANLGLVDLITENLKDAPQSATLSILGLRSEMITRDPMWFNEAEHFKEATQEVLDEAHEAFAMLGQASTWKDEVGEDGKAPVERMEKMAKLCAMTGEHEAAIRLLTTALTTKQQQDASESSLVGNVVGKVANFWLKTLAEFGQFLTGAKDKNGAEHKMMLQVLRKLFDQGLPAPWPATVVRLIDLNENLLGEVETWARSHPHSAEHIEPEADILALVDADSNLWKRTKFIKQLPDSGPPDKLKPRYLVRRHGSDEGEDVGLVVRPGSDGPGALLRAAARLGKTELVRRLLHAKVSLRETDKSATTALHLAAIGGHVDVAKLLLDSKGSMVQRTTEGKRPLDFMFQGHHTKLGRATQKSSMDVVFEDFEKVYKQNDEHGELIEILRRDQHTAESRETLLGMLKALEEDETSAMHRCTLTPLILICRYGTASNLDTFDIARTLIEHSADVAFKNKEGITALTVAADRGLASVVPMLLTAGANIEDALDDGMTPLMLACKSGEPHTVARLLKCKADPHKFDTKAEAKFTPLMHCSLWGHADTVINLLSHLRENGSSADFKKSLDTQKEDGYTALNLAALQGQLKVVRLLLHAGADVDIGNVQEDHGPLAGAAKNGHAAVVRTLMQMGAEVNKQELVPAPTEQAKKRLGFTALHHACQKGQVACVLALLKGKADPNIEAEVVEKVKGEMKVTAGKMTPLHLACEKNSVRVVELLIQHNADVARRNSMGLIPFVVAKHMGHTTITEHLQPVRYALTKQFKEINSVKVFKLARRAVRQFGISRLEWELAVAGFLDGVDPQRHTLRSRLTTDSCPFNIYARLAQGKQKQPLMADANKRLHAANDDFKDFLIASHGVQQDENWDSNDTARFGSLSKRHKLLLVKYSEYEWFNVLTCGLTWCHKCKGGQVGRRSCADCDPKGKLEHAIETLERMRAAALHFACDEGWSNEIGLYLNVYPHCSVNSFHLHIVDLECKGPSLNALAWRNLPLDAAQDALKQELGELQREKTRRA